MRDAFWDSVPCGLGRESQKTSPKPCYVGQGQQKIAQLTGKYAISFPQKVYDYKAFRGPMFSVASVMKNIKNTELEGPLVAGI
jgi:hypothetical protein